IFFATSGMDFNAIARTKGDTLEIDQIQLNQAGTPARRGAAPRGAGGGGPPPNKKRIAYRFVFLPFLWKNLGTKSPVIPSSGKVSAILQSQDLDLKKLFTDLGIKAMTSGFMNARLDADGTIANLNTRLAMQVRDIRNEYWPRMEPATFDLNVEATQNRLTASG